MMTKEKPAVKADAEKKPVVVPEPDPEAELDQLERETRTLQAQATAHRMNAREFEAGPKAYRDKANAELKKAAECDKKMLELQEEMRHVGRSAEEKIELRKAREAAKAEEERMERAVGKPGDGHQPDLGEFVERKVKVYEKDRRGPHRFHKDIETDFDKMDVVVVPKDTSYGFDDRHASEPNWNVGWYLQDRATGQPVEGWNVDGGPPPRALIEAWRDGLTINGLLLFRDRARHN